MKKQFIIPAAIALVLGGGIAALQTTGAFAQAQVNNPAPWEQQQQGDQSQRPHRDFAARLEHRIDHLKSELKITPAQEPQFNQFAQALRDNAAERQKNFQDLRGTPDQHRTAVDRLEIGVKLTQIRVEQDQRTLAALRPLYASLSADQKQIADHMFGPHHGRGHRHA